MSIDRVGRGRGRQLVAAARKGHKDVVSLLLDRGADVNEIHVPSGLENHWSITALSAAAHGGHQDVVSLLLGRGADVNLVAHGATALIAAAGQRYNENVVSLLLDRGADVNLVAHDTTALIAAAGKGHENVVSLLLYRDANMNLVAHDTTALIAAAGKGHKNVISLLLDRGADVNLVAHDITALIAAAGQWCDQYVVSLLLDRGADVNLVADNTTALIAAAGQWYNQDVVSLLLDRGADMNLVAHDTTALIAAAGKGHKNIVSLLLDQGADVNLVAHDTTALIAAAGKGYKDVVSLLLDRSADMNLVAHDATALIVAAGHRYNQDVISLLLDRGADVNLVAHDTTALIAAAGKGYEHTVLLLLYRDADVNLVAHDSTALIAAAGKGHNNVVSLLLDRGIDVNLVAHDSTALIAAAREGHEIIVWLLLNHGTDVNLIADDTTALIAAAREGRGVILLRLLDRGADVNLVVYNSTALIVAAGKGYEHTVLLLLYRGADVNLVAHDSTALIAAAGKGHKNVVSLLLDRGADVNLVAHDSTALIAAAEKGHKDVVSLLLDHSADVNLIAHDITALIPAARGGHEVVVSLLLDHGADVKLVAHDTTALIAAITTETVYMSPRGKWHARVDIVRMLLDRGAELNMVIGQYGTVLIAAIICDHSSTRGSATRLQSRLHSPTSDNMIQRGLLSALMDRNPDVSIRAGVHGTALIATISKLQFPEQTNCNFSSGWQWTFLNRLLSSVYLTLDHINVAVGEHGAPLAAAISKGNLQLLRLLVEKGGDIGRLGDSCGIASRAAFSAGWESQRLCHILQYLVDRGADINVVASQKFGSVLGQAVYMGDRKLVSFLLGCGADPFHVGGTHHRAALRSGAYPNALDAALSPASNCKAQSDLVAMLSNAMECSGKFQELQRSPPFPMPYTRSMITVAKMTDGPSTCSDPEGICDLPAYAALTAQHADISCTILKEELIVKALVQLVIGTGTDTLEFKRYEDWIRNDVRYFVTQGYDFGEAYAAAKVGWRHFNRPDFVHLVEQHRGQWLGIAQEIDKERINSIHRDNTEQEMIKLPYQIMPRRLWDLQSNRVVEFRMLQSELLAYKSTTKQQFGKARAKLQSEVPVFWAISHSWESSMDSVKTPINQFQWQVPLPHGLDLEHDVRQGLLKYGIEYIWLDVMCLRQHATSAPAEAKKEEEWKLDVPTIGNIYRAAQGIVRYFNGLGRPFSSEGWDSDRHWLHRAWTLQEIKTENSTINAGIPRDPTSPTGPTDTSISNIMNIRGMMAGQAMTLRRAIRPVLQLAADVDSHNGCSLYALVREMSQRKATQSTDKVAGLVYLLRLTQLPTYDKKADDNGVWAKCFHMLPLARKVELLFDFPYRSSDPEKQHWFPTWRELMTWPEVNPECDYSPATQPEGPEIQDLVDLTESKEVADEVAKEGSLFLSCIWALSQCSVTCGRGSEDYNVREEATGNVYGFYDPYNSQKPIEFETTSSGQQYEFTIATASLGNSNNWVVCRVVKKLKTRCNSTFRSGELGPEEKTCESGEMPQQSSEIEIEVLRKVCVLRTDFCGEMSVGVGARGGSSALRRIHALFI